MEKKQITIWILHAGIEHPSPYFYNFCRELSAYNNFEFIINPDLPSNKKVNNGIIYFNRLKRFYNSNDINTANKFLDKIDHLKQIGWKIVWTIHNFFPIDRNLSDVDEFITKEFINKCDLVFTLSEYMAKSINKHYNVVAINHGVGVNMVNSDDINPSIKKLKKSKRFTFTFIGNIYKYKMLDYVIASFNRTKDSRLIIAGKEAKNANVNIDKLIKNNKNIIFINSFITKKDWDKLSKLTDVFISVYNLDLPAFKYGFFPSNFINISKTGIKCISPKSKIFEELISREQIITYDFEDKNGLYNAMIEAKTLNCNRVNINQEYDYTWDKVVKIFVDNCNKLF